MSKELFYFELEELIEFLLNVTEDEQVTDRDEIDTYVSGIHVLTVNTDQGKATVIPALASRAKENETRIHLREDFILKIIASLRDQAGELQQRCREQRTAEAAREFINRQARLEEDDE